MQLNILGFWDSSSGIPAGIPELECISQSLVPVFQQEYRNWASYSENGARPFINGAKKGFWICKKPIGYHGILNLVQDQNRMLEVEGSSAKHVAFNT